MRERPRQLDVYLHDRVVAHIEDRPNLPVTYSNEALAELRGLPVISCSLPVSNRKVSGRNFFDGVLPEGQFRAALAARANVAANDTYGLLAAFGRDIAGALVIVDSEQAGSTDSHGRIRLSEDDLEREVAELPLRPVSYTHLTLPTIA